MGHGDLVHHVVCKTDRTYRRFDILETGGTVILQYLFMTAVPICRSHSEVVGSPSAVYMTAPGLGTAPRPRYSPEVATIAVRAQGAKATRQWHPETRIPGSGKRQATHF